MNTSNTSSDTRGPEPAPGPSPRTIRPRRGLPSGRAVAGALLVTAAATGAFLAATSGESGPDTSYLVLTSAIATGEAVTATDVTAVALDLGDVVSAAAVPAATPIDGATALRTLRPGELLMVDDLLASPDLGGERLGAVHELTLPVPGEWTPSYLLPGDRVTVLATVREAVGERTVVAVEDAPVIEFDTGDAGLGGRAARLTLALARPADVVAVAHLAQRGDVTVVRSTRALSDRYPTEPAADTHDPAPPESEASP